nr:hypothetical protein [Streptomyces sp. CC210A]
MQPGVREGLPGGGRGRQDGGRGLSHGVADRRGDAGGLDAAPEGGDAVGVGDAVGGAQDVEAFGEGGGVLLRLRQGFQAGAAPGEPCQVVPDRAQAVRGGVGQGEPPAGDVRGRRQGQVERAEGPQGAETLQGGGAVTAVPAGAAGGAGEVALLGVEAHGPHGHARPLGQFPDAPCVVAGHSLNLSLRQFLRYGPTAVPEAAGGRQGNG